MFGNTLTESVVQTGYPRPGAEAFVVGPLVSLSFLVPYRSILCKALLLPP